MLTSHIPYETIKSIAQVAQTKVDDQITTILADLAKTTADLKKVIEEKKVESDIITKYAKAPMYDDKGVFVAFQPLSGKGGKDHVHEMAGTMLTKYMKLSEGYHKLVAADAKKGAALGAKREDVEKQVADADVLIKLIEQLKVYPEIEAMPATSKLIRDVESDSKRFRSELFGKLHEKVNKVVQYPNLDESFQQREVSYQIEPSGIQGSGHETRFMFQDFLRSRNLDEDSQ